MHEKKTIPRIYPIIDSGLIAFEHMEKTAQAIANGGAKILQLRAKDFSSAEFLKSAMIIRKITKKNGIIFIVNDRVDVALLSDADGVHLGQEDIPVKEARRLVGDDKIIGYSTHNLREAHAAKKLPVDYISFGPIFSTKTKHDAETPKGIRGLSEAVNAAGIPVVAIGGITESAVGHALKQGAASAAMISDILTAPDIAGKVRRLIQQNKL